MVTSLRMCRHWEYDGVNTTHTCTGTIPTVLLKGDTGSLPAGNVTGQVNV